MELDGVVLIRALLFAASAAWLVPLLTLWPAVLRILRREARGSDSYAFVFWFVASMQIGFSLRWLLYGQAMVAMDGAELALWSGCWVLSILCATAVMAVVRVRGGGR